MGGGWWDGSRMESSGLPGGGAPASGDVPVERVERLWMVLCDGGSRCRPVVAEAVQPPNQVGPLALWAGGQVVAVFAAGEWDAVISADAMVGGESRAAASAAEADGVEA